MSDFIMASTASDAFSHVNVKTIGILSLVLLLIVSLATHKQKLPPGAKRLPRLPGIPWVGRVWDVPPSVTEFAWHFASFFKKYGPIYEWQAMGEIHIWIGKDCIARDLLLKRAKLYGDRHEIPSAVGIKTGSEILPLMGIGDNVST